MKQGVAYRGVTSNLIAAHSKNDLVYLHRQESIEAIQDLLSSVSRASSRESFGFSRKNESGRAEIAVNFAAPGRSTDMRHQ